MACVITHAAMSDAGCILEYHIVIMLTWYGLKHLR